MTQYRKFLLASSIGMAMGLTACGGSGYESPQVAWTPPPPPPPVTPPPPPVPCVPVNKWDYC
jgi:hypothetical protein